MSTVFLCKKISCIAACTLGLFITIGACIYARVLSKVQTVALNEQFYFLASENMNVEVGAFESVQKGGAGYILEENGREYAVTSVYFTEEAALRVQEGLAEEMVLICKKPNALYLKTQSEKNNAGVLKGAFSCLKSCIEILSDEIVRLDGGATQESSKRLLEILQKQYDYLHQEYKKSFPAFSSLCERAERALDTIISGTVFSKDLRYLLCELCVSYNELAGAFAL